MDKTLNHVSGAGNIEGGRFERPVRERIGRTFEKKEIRTSMLRSQI